MEGTLECIRLFSRTVHDCQYLGVLFPDLLVVLSHLRQQAFGFRTLVTQNENNS